MRKAIAENPRESSQRVLIYGTRLVPYTPHFYLGYALSKLNDCNSARGELAQSDSQNIIQKEDEYKLLKQALATCGPAPQPVVQTASTTTAVTTTRPPAVATVATETRAQLPPQPQPPVVTASITPQPPTAVPVPTTTAAEAAASAAASRRDLQARINDAERLLASNKPNSGSAETRTARANLTSFVAKAKSALSTNSSTPTWATVLSNSLQSYRLALRSMPPPPPALLSAITAYGKGDYLRAVQLLTSNPPADAPYRAQAALIRAAARYSQSIVSGNAKLLDDAKADVTEYRKLDRKATIDKRLFTPRFQAFAADVLAKRPPQT
jgi:hypothetical protein